MSALSDIASRLVAWMSRATDSLIDSPYKVASILGGIMRAVAVVMLVVVGSVGGSLLGVTEAQAQPALGVYFNDDYDNANRDDGARNYATGTHAYAETNGDAHNPWFVMFRTPDFSRGITSNITLNITITQTAGALASIAHASDFNPFGDGNNPSHARYANNTFSATSDNITDTVINATLFITAADELSGGAIAGVHIDFTPSEESVIRNDADDEPPTFVTVRLNPGTGYTVASGAESITFIVYDTDPGFHVGVNTTVVEVGDKVKFEVDPDPAGSRSVTQPHNITYTINDPDNVVGGTRNGTLEVPVTDDNTSWELTTSGTITGEDKFFTVDYHQPVEGGYQILANAVPDHRIRVTPVGGTLGPLVHITNTTDQTRVESDGNIKVSLVADTNTIQGTTIRYNVSQTGAVVAGLAADGHEVRTSPITMGQSSVEATINLAADTTDEATGTVTITVLPQSAGGAAYRVNGTNNAVTFTIYDDDPSMSISTNATASTITEGDTINVTITAAAATSQSHTIGFNASIDGGAATDHQVTIASGETTGSVGISVTDDAISQTDRTLVLTMLPAAQTSGYSLGTPSSVSLTVKDNDAGIELGDASVDEGGVARFNVTVLPIQPNAVTITYSTLADTANASDFTPVSDGTIEVPANTANATITIQTTTDTIHEGDETFNVTATSSAFAGTTHTASNVVTIVDDDAEPVIGISGPSVIALGGNITYTLAITNGVTDADDLTVALAVTIAGSGSTRSIHFPAGESSVDFNVTAGTTANETVAVLINSGSGYTVATAPNNEARTTQVAEGLTVSTVTVTEGGSEMLTIGLVPVQSADVPVTLTATAGTAEAGDYTVPTTATIMTGNTNVNVTIQTNQDTVHEGDETFTVAASANFGGGNPHTAQATVTISDDDPEPAMTISGPSNIPSGRNATYTVRIDNGVTSSRDLTVSLTATGAGVGKVYEGGSEVVSPSAGFTTTVINGQSQATFVVEGSATAGNDNVVLSLSNGTNYQLASTNSLTASTVDVGVSLTALAVTEGETANVTIDVTKLPTESATVTWRTTDDTATGGTGGAVGTDYTTQTSQSLTFAAGVSQMNVTIPTMTDDISEGDETFFVNATARIGSTDYADNAVVTITDGTPLPEIAISGPTILGTGLNGSYTMEITNSVTAAANLTVNLNRAQGGTSTTLPVVLAAGESSVNFNVSGGSTAGENVTLTFLGGQTGFTANSTRDTIEVAVVETGLSFVDAGTLTLDEGDSATFNFTLLPPPDSNVRVRATRVFGGTAGGADASLASTQSTVLAGETMGQITLNARDDNFDEAAAETLTLNITTTIAGVEYSATRAVEINDTDDPPLLGVTVTERGMPFNRPTEITFIEAFDIFVANGESPAISAYNDRTIMVQINGTDGVDSITYNSVAQTVTGNSTNVSVTLDQGDEGTLLPIIVQTKAQDPTYPIVVTILDGGNDYRVVTGPMLDARPSVSLDVRSLTVEFVDDTPTAMEGSPVTLNFRLRDASTQATTINWRTADGTALRGTHYQAAASGTVTINAGETQASLPITILNNNVDAIQNDHDFTVEFDATVEGHMSSGTATVTVRDDDSGGPVIALSTVSAAGSGRNITVSLTSEGGADAITSERDVELRLRARGNSTGPIYNGTATIQPTGNRTDFTVVLPAGETQVNVTVQTSDNSTVYDPLMLELRTGADYRRGAVPMQSVRIDALGIAFNPGTPIGDEGMPITFTVNLLTASSSQVTLDYTTSHGRAGVRGALAEAGVHYTPVSDTLTFAAGVTSQTVTIQTLDNDNYRADGSPAAFTFNVTGTIDGKAIDESTGVAIREDDPIPVMAMTSPVRSILAGRNVTLSVATTNGITIGQVGEDIDIFFNGSVAAVYYGNGTEITTTTASDGSTQIRALLPGFFQSTDFILETEDIDNPLPIRAVLGTDPGRASSEAYNLASGQTVVEVEIRTLNIAFDPVSLQVEEGEVAALNITIDPPQADAIEVAYTTMDGSAIGGTHYTTETATVTIPANAASALIDIATIDDAVKNTRVRAFTLAANATVAGDLLEATATITITDPDEDPVLGLVGPSRVGPGRNGTYTVVSNRTASDIDRDIMIQVNGSVAAIYPLPDPAAAPLAATRGNGSASVRQLKLPDGTQVNSIVPRPGVNSTLFSVVLGAFNTSASFVVQAMDEGDINASNNETLQPITVAIVSGGTGYAVNPDPTRQIAVSQIRAGFDTGRLNRAILPQVIVGILDEATRMIAERTHDSFGDSPEGLRRGFSIDGLTALGFAESFARREAAREAAENPWDATSATSRRLTQLPDATDLAFALPINQGEGSSSINIWGQGFFRNVAGTQDGVEFDGDIPGGVFGVDVRLNDGLMAGVGYSVAEADFGYTTDQDDETVRGDHTTELGTIHPYIGWRSDGGASLWGSLAIGEGEVTIKQAGDDSQYIGEITVQGFGLGFTSLADVREDSTGSIALNVHGDINFATIEETPNAVSRDAFDATGSELDVGRARLGATISHRRGFGDGGSLRQAFDLAVRYDSGDIAEGGAIELGGEVGLDLPSGFQLDLTARTLLTHEESIDDWGVAGSLAWSSQPNLGGRGLQLVLSPEWGNTASRGDALLDSGIDGMAADGSGVADARYGFDVRYGIPLLRGGLLVPFVTGEANAAADARYGTQYNLGGFATGVESDNGEGNAFIRFQSDF